MNVKASHQVIAQAICEYYPILRPKELNAATCTVCNSMLSTPDDIYSHLLSSIHIANAEISGIKPSIPFLTVDSLDGDWLYGCKLCGRKPFSSSQIDKHIKKKGHVMKLQMFETGMSASQISKNKIIVPFINGSQEGTVHCTVCEVDLDINNMKAHLKCQEHKVLTILGPNCAEVSESDNEEQSKVSVLLKRSLFSLTMGPRNGAIICALCGTGQLYKKTALLHLECSKHHENLAAYHGTRPKEAKALKSFTASVKQEQIAKPTSTGSLSADDVTYARIYFATTKRLSEWLAE